MPLRARIDAAAEQPTAGDLFGHPKGLTILFATEMWERFSYYGMSSLVVLYMNKYLFQGGRVEAVLGYGAVKDALEFLLGPLERQPLASLIYGTYTGLAYLTPVLGGLLADRVLGQRRTAVIGAVLMSIGHFMMTSEKLFLPALAMLILGVGTFKPNISTQVGGLYAAGDVRRIQAYSIFYVGINLGAFLAPLVCGTLGLEAGWHYGFGAAGVGMLIGLAIYLYGWDTLPPETLSRPHLTRSGARPLDSRGRGAIIALAVLCVPVSLFWAAYDQQGNTIVLWAEDFSSRSIDILGWSAVIPTTWFLALNPLMIFAFTPLLVRLWSSPAVMRVVPSTIGKMAFGCLCLALANLTMMAAAWDPDPQRKVSWLWLVGYFALATIGELHLAPVGLTLISRVAPARYLSVMMGVWFATTFPGDLIGGWLGSFWSTMAKDHFFLMIATVAAVAAAAIQALSRPLRSALEA